MRDPVPQETAGERVLSLLMLGVFWAAFACLAAGLALWVSHRADAHALVLLTTGLLGLLAMPVLKLAAITFTAAARRDRLTLVATIAVMVILGALTLRDALTR